MTIPKPISDAIDNFESKAVDHWMHDHYGTDRATFDAKRRLVTDARAALEAAIAASEGEAFRVAMFKARSTEDVPYLAVRLYDAVHELALVVERIARQGGGK